MIPVDDDTLVEPVGCCRTALTAEVHGWLHQTDDGITPKQRSDSKEGASETRPADAMVGETWGNCEIVASSWGMVINA